MLHPRAETGGVPPIIPKEYGLLLTCYALYVVSLICPLVPAINSGSTCIIFSFNCDTMSFDKHLYNYLGYVTFSEKLVIFKSFFFFSNDIKNELENIFQCLVMNNNYLIIKLFLQKNKIINNKVFIIFTFKKIICQSICHPSDNKL